VRTVPWPLLVVAMLAGCCCGGDRQEPVALTVTTRCAGLDAESIEWSVTQPLEVAAVQVGGIQRMESVSAPGTSSIELALMSGTDRFRAAEFLAPRLGDAELPQGCDPPGLGLGNEADRLVFEVALTGEGPAVEDAAADLRMQWLAMVGVDRVMVRGLPERQVRIAMDTAATAALGIDVNDVVTALDGNGVWPIDDLRSLDIGVVAPGTTVGDVAEIVLDQSHPCGRSWLDGEPAVVLGVLRLPEQGSVEMDRALAARFESWLQEQPPGVTAARLSDDNLTVDLTAPGPLTPVDLAGITTAIEELEPARVVLDLGVGDGGVCRSDPGRARIGVAWGDQMPAQARDEVRQAVDSVPGLDGHVSLPMDPVVAVRITAEDLADLDGITTAVRDRLATVPDVAEFWDDRPSHVDEVRVVADRQAVAACGIAEWQVEQAALAARDGVTVSRMEIDGAFVSFVVTIGHDPPGADLPSLLRDVLVRTGDRRASIPLQDLVRVEILRSPSSVRRLHLMRTVTVYVRHAPAALRSVRETLATALSEIELPAGASVRVED